MSDYTYLRGGAFLVYTGSNAWDNRIAYSKTCALEVKTSTVEVSSPSTGVFKTYLPVKTEWTVSVSGLIADSRNDTSLFDMMTARTEVSLLIYQIERNSAGSVTDPEQPYYMGNALLTSLELTAENQKVATYQAKFTGCGELKKMT